ncbi:MAG: ABC transporter substrate-binding protein [Firmicutes bacterium]|nr:ABC transporter substrate-binding protein [Bacillota bacterium]
MARIFTRQTFLIALLALSLAMGFGLAGGGALAAKPADAIKISLPTWSGYAPLLLAKEKGYFEKHGANVEFVVIQGLAERKQALAANRIQGMATALDVHVTLAAAGIPIKVVVAMDHSSGGDGILAKPGIKSLADLKGKTVAFMQGSTSHLFFLTALEKSGVPEDAVKAVDMTAGDAGAAFVAGKVDAAVTWEPWLSKAEKEGAGKVLVSTRDFPGLIVDSLAFRADTVKQNPEAIKGIVAAWYEAIEFWKAHPDEANAIMARALNWSVAEFAETLPGLSFYDKAANLAFFGTPKAPGAIYATAKRAADFYYNKKVIDRKPDINEMIDAAFLK